MSTLLSPSPGHTFTLTDLIHPVPPSDFFAKYWEHRPLHISRSDSNYFTSLLSVDEIDRIISETDLATVPYNIVNADDQIERSAYMAPDHGIDIVRVF